MSKTFWHCEITKLWEKDMFMESTYAKLKEINNHQIYFVLILFIKTYLTRMTHQPEAVLHEVPSYTITQFIHMVTRKST